MAYNDDAVLAKLSALNESHDSIATAAQWIMFHRRHAERTVQLWMQRLKDSSSAKRLSLIYLANEVTQQSKARHKDDFVVAFSPVIAEATATAYRGAPADIQAKLRRVVDVWKDRLIFEAPIQTAIESRLEELDKARGAPKPAFGSSAFGSSSTSSVPSELAPLAAAQQNLVKLVLPTKTATSSATQEYEKLLDPSTPLPKPPVYAARLHGLLKTLATAEGAVSESVKARKELLGALEKIVSTNRAALETEETMLATLAARKKEIEGKKADVELAIVRGLGQVEKSPVDGADGGPLPELDRPEVEALTPPPTGDEPPQAEPLSPPTQSPVATKAASFQSTPAAPGIEMLSTLASQYQSLPVATNGSNKRRRVDDGDDFPDLGGDDGIDADVAEILRRDSGGS